MRVRFLVLIDESKVSSTEQYDGKVSSSKQWEFNF